MSPVAVWLEERYDRAQRLRAAHDHLFQRLARTDDPVIYAAIEWHLTRVDAALTRLGATP